MRNRPTILILGGTGFLGSYFAKYLHEKAVVHTSGQGLKRVPNDQIKLDITKHSEFELERIFHEYSFSQVINCIALADIELCERFPDHAYWLNRSLPIKLSQLSLKYGFKLTHISTDAVFDGSKPNRFEEEIPSPTNVYSTSKLEGELGILDINPLALIARVNFVGRNPKGNSLFDFYEKNLILKNLIEGYTNLYFTPLWVTETIKVVTELISKSESGIFHVTGTKRISKYEFGCLVADRLNVDRAHIKPTEFLNPKNSPKRSLDLSLSNEKLKKLGIKFLEIDESIGAFVHVPF